jgi:hypothetical protein
VSPLVPFTLVKGRLSSFSQYLETLCDLLYDDLRPRILHEARLTALCEVCTVLQALMVLDAPISTSTSSTLFSLGDGSSDTGTEATSDDEESEEDESDASDSELTVDLDTVSLSSKRKAKGKLGQVGKRLHIRHLLQMVLQDAQTRLFFKAQSLLHSDIKYYAPRKEDLAWPDVIVGEYHLSSSIHVKILISTKSCEPAKNGYGNPREGNSQPIIQDQPHTTRNLVSNGSQDGVDSVSATRLCQGESAPSPRS